MGEGGGSRFGKGVMGRKGSENGGRGEADGMFLRLDEELGVWVCWANITRERGGGGGLGAERKRERANVRE